MADVESQVVEATADERTSSGEWGQGSALRGTSSARAASRGSGITWWEACGGWKCRIALSM